jgi:hypothetical protein
VSKAGIITTVAGSGEAGQGGDGGAATDAKLIGPTAAVPTPDGGFLLGSYSTSTTDLVVRKVTASGTIKTVAGTTTAKPNPKCSFKSAVLGKAKKKPAIKAKIVCNQGAKATVKGTIKHTLKLKGKTVTRKRKIAAVTKSVLAGRIVTFTLKLPKAAIEGLKRGDRESAKLKLTARNANGPALPATRTIKKLKLPKKPASSAR